MEHSAMLDYREIPGPYGGVRYFIYCRNCEMRTGYHKTPALARESWKEMKGRIDCVPADEQHIPDGGSFRDRIRNKGR